MSHNSAIHKETQINKTHHYSEVMPRSYSGNEVLKIKVMILLKKVVLIMVDDFNIVRVNSKCSSRDSTLSQV